MLVQSIRICDNAQMFNKSSVVFFLIVYDKYRNKRDKEESKSDKWNLIETFKFGYILFSADDNQKGEIRRECNKYRRSIIITINQFKNIISRVIYIVLMKVKSARYYFLRAHYTFSSRTRIYLCIFNDAWINILISKK